MIKVKLVRSYIGCNPKQKKTLEAMGLRRIGQTNELPDNGSTKGQIKRVSHLVEVVE
jgi:large subunit ribosomal protein L30